MTNFSSPQQLKTLENSPNTPPNRLSLYKTPLRTDNGSEHPIEMSRSGSSDPKTAEINCEFFNGIALKRTFAQRALWPRRCCQLLDDVAGFGVEEGRARENLAFVVFNSHGSC